MLVSKVFSRISRSSATQFRYFSSYSRELLPNLPSNSNLLLESATSFNKWALCQRTQPLHCLDLGKGNLQRFGLSSSAYPQPTDKEAIHEEQRNVSSHVKSDTKAPNETEKSDTDTDLCMDDLVKLIAEKEELLKVKDKEVEVMQDKVLRTYAEMENVMDRTRREAENTKKFAIQNFAKSLLDVADNLRRASFVVNDSFPKIDHSKDSDGAVLLLKTLLEGVEMTEKQLAEVLKKFGVERFDPINENFDPNRHYAIFQVPDASKPAGTIAAVLKPGYMLYDRVLRPAEVGVTDSPHDAGQSPST